MKRRDFCKGLAVAFTAGALSHGTPARAASDEIALVGKAVPDDSYILWYRSDRCGADRQHTFYYSDSLFDRPAVEYDNRLALITLAMTAASASTWDSEQRYWEPGEAGRADNIRDAFAQLGFAEVELFNYDHSLNETPDTSSCAVARKTLVQGGRRVTILGAFLRGAGYGAEWSGNLHAGSGSAHTGFLEAARQLIDPLRDYVDRMDAKEPLGTLKFWLGGYSRGGAVANLLAAQLPVVLPQLSRANTYVYTFAAPASLAISDYPEWQQDYDNNHNADGTLKNDWDASNIFNIVSSGDIIPRLLPEGWGFHRNGNDRFLPATLMPEERKDLNERWSQLDGLQGTEMAYDQLATAEQTDAVLQMLMDFFESRQKYYEVYEPALRCMLQCACTRTEAEWVQGVVPDDAAIVERLRGMDGMERFSQEEIKRNVQKASVMSRPILEKLGSAVPQWIVISVLAVGLCYDMENYVLTYTLDFVLSLFQEEGRVDEIVRSVLCHFVENYMILLEYYVPEEHGMEPYTRG